MLLLHHPLTLIDAVGAQPLQLLLSSSTFAIRTLAVARLNTALGGFSHLHLFGYIYNSHVHTVNRKIILQLGLQFSRLQLCEPLLLTFAMLLICQHRLRFVRVLIPSLCASSSCPLLRMLLAIEIKLRTGGLKK